jgi:hypothetical protein
MFLPYMRQFMPEDPPTFFCFQWDGVFPEKILSVGEGGVVVIGAYEIKTIHPGNNRGFFQPVYFVNITSQYQ